MNGYENGKIYKVVDKNDNIIYIGSTKTSLKERWRKHLLNCDEYNIKLIENYPCECKRELVKYEQKFIDLYSEMGLLNKHKAYRSKEERKQYEKEYDKKYKQSGKHRESLNKYQQSDKYKEQRKKYKQSENYKQSQKIKANCHHCNILMLKRYISKHIKLYCKNKPIDND